MSKNELLGDAPGSQSSSPPRRRSLLRRLAEYVLAFVLLAVLAVILWVKFTPEGAEIWQLVGNQIWGGRLSAAQQQAVEALRKRDALVVSGGPGQGIASINFAAKDVDDEALKEMVVLDSLQHVNLAQTNVRDEQLKYLAGLPQLTSVVLGGTEITDAGTVYLAKLSGVESLLMSGTKVSDAGLENLARLTNLRVLDLSNTQVTDAGLPHLANLRKLAHLLLQGDDITDAGLAHLEEFPSLRRLTILKGMKATPAAIAKLKSRARDDGRELNVD